MTAKARPHQGTSESAYGIALRILSGVYEGKLVELSTGTWLVGRESHCDLVFREPFLKPEHFTLHVRENGIELVLCSEASLEVDGRSIRHTPDNPGPEQCQPGVRYQIGGMAFEFQVIVNRLNSEQDADLLKTSQKDSPQAVLFKWQEGAKQAAARAYASFRPAKPEKHSAGDQRLGATAWNLIIMFLGFSIGLAPVAYSLNKSDQTDIRHVQTIENATPVSVNQLIDSLGFSDLVARFGSGNTVEIVGNLASQAELAQLRAALESRGWSVNLKGVRVGAEVLDSVRTVLSGMGFDRVSVGMDESGAIVLSGYVQDEAAWKSAKALLASDVARHQKFVDKTQTIRDRLNLLSELVKKSGIENRLSLNINRANEILATGVLNRGERMRWKAVVEQFVSLYGEYPKIKSSIDDMDKTLQMDVRGLFIGPETAYLIMADGSRYMKGSVTQNGYLIRDISEQGIVLQKDGKEQVLYPEL